MSVIVFGTGKSVILSRIFLEGLTSSFVIRNPANSTSCLEKIDFFLLKKIPFFEQSVK